VRKAEHVQSLAPAKWWKRIWNGFWRYFNSPSDNVLELLPTLDENQIIGIATDALGSLSAAHKRFQENEPVPEQDGSFVPLNEIPPELDESCYQEIAQSTLATDVDAVIQRQRATVIKSSNQRTGHPQISSMQEEIDYSQVESKPRSALQLRRNQGHYSLAQNLSLQSKESIIGFEMQEVVVDHGVGLARSLVSQSTATTTGFMHAVEQATPRPFSQGSPVSASPFRLGEVLKPAKQREEKTTKAASETEVHVQTAKEVDELPQNSKIRIATSGLTPAIPTAAIKLSAISNPSSPRAVQRQALTDAAAASNFLHLDRKPHHKPSATDDALGWTIVSLKETVVQNPAINNPSPSRMMRTGKTSLRGGKAESLNVASEKTVDSSTSEVYHNRASRMFTSIAAAAAPPPLRRRPPPPPGPTPAFVSVKQSLRVVNESQCQIEMSCVSLPVAAEEATHECSTRCDGTNADLVEVVVDPPSAAIVEGGMRTSSSGHCRVPTQMDVFHASSSTASSLKAERSASLKHLNEGPLKDDNVHPGNKSKDGDTFRDVAARSARLDANRNAMPPSTLDSAARMGVAVSTVVTISTRASSRPKRSLQHDGHEASQSRGAHLPLSVPASISASAAPASVPADFIEKIDSKSGRHFWVNLKTKTRSWAPPDAVRARDNTTVTSELSTAGGASARNVTTSERRMPGSNDIPSSNEQGNQNVSNELEEALYSAAPPVQRDNQKSASVRHQDHTQSVHTTSARLSASTLAVERMRRQNLADLAAFGYAPHDASHALETRALSSDAAVTAQALRAAGGASARNLHTLERGMPDSNQSPSSNAQSNQKASIELESGTITNSQSDGIQELQAGMKASAVKANAASVRVKQPTLATDAVTSGSSQPEAQRPRDPIHVAKPSDAPPPPFDDDDLKLAKRREEKAAARAAQRSLMSAAGAKRSTGDEAPPHCKSHSEVDELGPPPPFDDDDLKLAKRREEKAAARAAQRSLMSTLGARGSKPLHRNPDKERE
jgi:hypothetical protein